MKVRSLQKHNYGAVSIIDARHFNSEHMATEEEFEKKEAQKSEPVTKKKK